MYIRDLIHAIRHPRIAMMGWCEADSDFGMTWGDPYTSRSRAYDFGRAARHGFGDN